MPTYKYTESETGFVYTIIVKASDVTAINSLTPSASVKLASGHRLDVNSNGVVQITSKDGKHSSVDLPALKSGRIS
ncbi:hypothetical protein CV_0138 [Chromobacterium violaceum ATCC 12472]|uniref:Uncharacterized protein n=1 Tax=Chromobacterium violaceum (strain ATCC 12472 / DSM 30191 / JCM 1249 / CCUG 213 / NBRC 12614 / NCIMB 9131 / NCTC 9757 / MK) TaxID=243365 RepID=Q7P1S5_CHRVO|nr:hypothetical protein CV_0138 [Chromobacterium violaceum ATCC 12472]